MTALKAAAAHVVFALAAITAFFGFGWCAGVLADRPESELAVWMYMWAGTGSTTLALTLATYCIEIADYLETLWTPTPRGRHARR